MRHPAIERIAALVHALDLDEEASPPPEASTMRALIEGLQRATPDDDALLAHGMTLFDALHRAYEHRVHAPAAVASKGRARRRRPQHVTSHRRGVR